MTLDERMVDIKERYDKYTGRPDLPEMIEAAKSIETEIVKSVDASLDEIITSDQANKYKEKLAAHMIK